MSNNAIIFSRIVGKDNPEAIAIGDEARKRLGIYGQPKDPFKWWARVRAGFALLEGKTHEEAIETVMYEFNRRIVTGIHRAEET